MAKKFSAPRLYKRARYGYTAYKIKNSKVGTKIRRARYERSVRKNG